MAEKSIISAKLVFVPAWEPARRWGGSAGRKTSRHIIPGKEIYWRGPLYDPRAPFSNAESSQVRPSAAGVVVQLPNGDQLLSITTYGYVIPSSVVRQEQGAFRQLFGGSREGQLILAIAMSPVGASQAEISSPVCLDN